MAAGQKEGKGKKKSHSGFCLHCGEFEILMNGGVVGLINLKPNPPTCI